MEITQGHMLDSLRSVKSFLELNADKLSGVIKSGIQAELLQTINELEAYGDQQTLGAAGAKNASKVARALRYTLIHDHMAVVSRIGRAKLPNTPEFENLKMPRGNPSSTRLTEAAYEMANSALQNAGVFVAAGLPEDFIVRLKSAADAVAEERLQRSLARAKRTVATRALGSKLSSARKLVHVLDAMVKTAIRSDPTLLPGWNQVKHVQKSTASAPAGAPPVPSAPTTPATPALAA
jgi:hypothetical protein